MAWAPAQRIPVLPAEKRIPYLAGCRVPGRSWAEVCQGATARGRGGLSPPVVCGPLQVAMSMASRTRTGAAYDRPSRTAHDLPGRGAPPLHQTRDGSQVRGQGYRDGSQTQALSRSQLAGHPHLAAVLRLSPAQILHNRTPPLWGNLPILQLLRTRPMTCWFLGLMRRPPTNTTRAQCLSRIPTGLLSRASPCIFVMRVMPRCLCGG